MILYGDEFRDALFYSLGCGFYNRCDIAVKWKLRIEWFSCVDWVNI